MKNLFLFAILIALCLGSAALVQNRRASNAVQVANVNASQAISAPFRDGLYLGKLTAERGEKMHIASGRWATGADRLSFTAGFQQGYQEKNLQCASNAVLNAK